MRLLAALGLAAAAALAPAHAEVWGFVGPDGVAHFAAEKLDERYELFFRGGESFDTSTMAEPPAAAPVPAPRPEPVPSASASAGRLLALFEVSPGFRTMKQPIAEVAREHGIELALLQALIATESGFDPGAVSPKGAIGLMQVMPATAERYGLRGGPKQPLARKLADPRTNLRTGARYLRDLLQMFPGRLELALAAYNAGEGAVQRAGNRIPNYPETQNYVRTVLQLYAVLKPEPPAAAPAAAPAAPPRRVRMELPGPTGTAARRNLPPVLPLENPAEPVPAARDAEPASARP